MDKFYHFTNYGNLASICIDGLVPTIGFRSMSVDETRRSVFLSKGMEQAITMYASMLWLYKDSIEKKNECIGLINRLSNMLELSGGQDDFLKKKINELNEALAKISLVCSCRNFNEYLGGDGCYLSVYGMEEHLFEDEENCWCNIPISVTNINAVYLKSRITGEISYSRDNVIFYFMSFFSPEQLAKGDKDRLEQVKYLYNQINKNYLNHLKYTCDLCEVSFNEYMNNKVKALIFN